MEDNLQEDEIQSYEGNNSIDFGNKKETTFWAFKLGVTKRQLRWAYVRTESNFVNKIEDYINKKFSF